MFLKRIAAKDRAVVTAVGDAEQVLSYNVIYYTRLLYITALLYDYVIYL